MYLYAKVFLKVTNYKKFRHHVNEVTPLCSRAFESGTSNDCYGKIRPIGINNNTKLHGMACNSIYLKDASNQSEKMSTML